MFWFTKLTSERKRTIGHWLMELVIVVAGVLIALWLQQWGEHRRAVRDMEAAEAAIHDELREALISLLWRQAIGKCHFDRALLLKTMLLKNERQWPGLNEDALIKNTLAEATGIETSVEGVYQRPSDAFSMAAWNSALATGALAPMDKGRFARIASMYDGVRMLIDIRDKEDAAAATLSALSQPQEITPETRTRMLSALYELSRSRFMFNFAAQPGFPEGLKELGWNDREEVDRVIREEAAGDREQGIKWRPCVKPMINPFADVPAKSKD